MTVKLTTVFIFVKMTPMPKGTTTRTTALGTAALMLITACASNDEGVQDADLTVVTGVYPLEWLAEEIGGDRVAVVQLTEPGAEPHDLELTGRQVGEVGEADIAFYVDGLQPAVDEAVEQEAPDSALDVSEVVELRPAADHDHDHGDHEHGDHDPHFWLDLDLMAETAEALADRMSEVDPEGAELYEDNLAEVTTELSALGQEYDQGLESCDSREVVVGHTAFTYLTEAHGLEQIGTSGVDPENEPSPTQIAAITDIVDERDITTVFTEPLMPGATAETIASETGAQVRVLDPLEGVTEDSPGDDYPSIMRGNLAALTEALGCD